MQEKVDAGDILKQPWFSVDEHDTALSLNLKCYEHAIQAFNVIAVFIYQACRYSKGKETKQLICSNPSHSSFYCDSISIPVPFAVLSQHPTVYYQLIAVFFLHY